MQFQEIPGFPIWSSVLCKCRNNKKYKEKKEPHYRDSRESYRQRRMCSSHANQKKAVWCRKHLCPTPAFCYSRKAWNNNALLYSISAEALGLSPSIFNPASHHFLLPEQLLSYLCLTWKSSIMFGHYGLPEVSNKTKEANVGNDISMEGTSKGNFRGWRECCNNRREAARTEKRKPLHGPSIK